MTASLPVALEWVGGPDGHCALLDQTLLPHQEVMLQIRDSRAMRDAICRLAVRGAPAIGIAAAYGLVLGAQELAATDPNAFLASLHGAADRLASARPTAVNLKWALNRMLRSIGEQPSGTVPAIVERLWEEAVEIHREDQARCDAMGRFGADLLRDGDTILTHCNAGSVATGGIGTALGVIHYAHRQGKRLHVFADETRPLLQGARITAWELMRAGVPATLICDSAAATVLAQGKISAVLVGADRIAGNGDAANKIGTYPLAVMAQRHGVPFYVVAPASTFDLHAPTGSHIPIEERDPTEVTCPMGVPTAPDGVGVYAPSFDVTPASLITAIVSDRGIVRPPQSQEILRVLGM